MTGITILAILIILKGLSFHEHLIVIIFPAICILIEIGIIMLQTRGGLFTDTVYGDEEKIVIEKKNYNRTIYWKNVKEIQKHYTRLGNIYYIVENGALEKETYLTEFSCSRKFSKYIYSVFEQVRKELL